MRDQAHVVCGAKEAEAQPPGAQQTPECLLCSYEFVLLDGRGDHVKGVNLGRALDKSCQRLQHLRIGIGAVSYTHLDVYKRQQHVVALEEYPLVAGDKVGAGDQVAGANRFRPETCLLYTSRCV